MEPIRVAVFGNGFARNVVLPCLRHVPGMRAVGIASPNLERAQLTANDFGLPHCTADHRALLEEARPDLVFVVSPPHRHLEMATDALSAGCHVVCEKPMALDASQTARMVAAAEAAPTRITVIDHELRYLPTRVALQGLVAEGALGRLLHAEYTLLSPGRHDAAAPWTWWSDRNAGGGALGAIGSHAVDALRSLLGEVAEVRGNLETFVRERTDPATGQPREVTADDYAAAWLRFTSGALATMTISLVEGERAHRVSLAGSAGAASITEQGRLRRRLGRDPMADVPCADDLPPSAELGIPDTDWARAFLRMTRLLARQIAAGASTLPGAATFADGHRAQLVLDAIRESAASGRWTAVQPG